MTTRQWFAKGQVNGLASRRLVITGYPSGYQTLVELRILDPDRRRDYLIDFSMKQAREALRLLTAAIKSANPNSCGDGGNSLAQDDRASPDEVISDAGLQAKI